MALNASTVMTDKAVDQMVTEVDQLKVFVGTVPASADAAETGTLALTYSLSGVTFGAASTSGSARRRTVTAGLPIQAISAATGTATYGRLYKSGVVHFQGDVGSEIVIDNTSLTSGVAVNLVSVYLQHDY